MMENFSKIDISLLSYNLLWLRARIPAYPAACDPAYPENCLSLMTLVAILHILFHFSSAYLVNFDYRQIKTIKNFI